MFDDETYAAAQSYTKDTVNGMGALRGAPCTISSIDEIENGHRVNFAWTANDGSIHTQSMDVRNGDSEASDLTEEQINTLLALLD